MTSGSRTRQYTRLPTVILLWILAGLPGCRETVEPPQSNLKTISMKLGNESFVLEVANDDTSREIGLMNRDSMPANHGMIFVFAGSELRNFWMKNTRIPLDIIFVDPVGQVVSVKSMEPYDLRSTPSDGPAQYAIELNVGAATRAGVKPGDKITLPANLTSADGR